MKYKLTNVAIIPSDCRYAEFIKRNLTQDIKADSSEKVPLNSSKFRKAHLFFLLKFISKRSSSSTTRFLLMVRAFSVMVAFLWSANCNRIFRIRRNREKMIDSSVEISSLVLLSIQTFSSWKRTVPTQEQYTVPKLYCKVVFPLLVYLYRPR